MKQKERGQISYNKILNAAIGEFGTKSYDNASLNNICSDNNISKGLIYHYFKNKDELFLSCVKVCFDNLAIYLNNSCNLTEYLNLRYKYFYENAFYSNIFFSAVLRPPAHLVGEIKELRKEFDAYNMEICYNALGKIKLREGISREEAIEYFYILQEMFNGYFQSKAYENADFHLLIEEHEMNLSKIINIMLYGIAEEVAK